MNKEDTKIRAIIITTGEQLFSVHGISGISLEDISAKSKIPVAVICKQYLDKDAVVKRVVKRIIRKLKSTLLLHVRKVNNISPAFILQFSFIENLVKYRSLFAEKELRNYEKSWTQFMNFRKIYAKNVIEINLSDYNVRKMLIDSSNSKSITAVYLDYVDTLIF